jgi:hypothetical protein
MEEVDSDAVVAKMGPIEVSVAVVAIIVDCAAVVLSAADLYEDVLTYGTTVAEKFAVVDVDASIATD